MEDLDRQRVYSRINVKPDSSCVRASLEISAVMLQLLEDIDALAACDPQLSLQRWLNDASACAETEQEAQYYRRNARTIITTWGKECSITDYATRLWSGLVKSYYAPRWKEYTERLLQCIKDGKEYDQASFFNWCDEFEASWAANDAEIAYNEPVDPVAFSRELLIKYGL